MADRQRDRMRDQLQAILGASYTLERGLGGIGMSRVFVTNEARLGRKVVVKVLAPVLAADSSAERDPPYAHTRSGAPRTWCEAARPRRSPVAVDRALARGAAA